MPILKLHSSSHSSSSRNSSSLKTHFSVNSMLLFHKYLININRYYLLIILNLTLLLNNSNKSCQITKHLVFQRDFDFLLVIPFILLPILYHVICQEFFNWNYKCCFGIIILYYLIFFKHLKIISSKFDRIVLFCSWIKFTYELAKEAIFLEFFLINHEKALNKLISRDVTKILLV